MLWAPLFCVLLNMINLASTSDLLKVITNAAGTIDVHCSWMDLVSTTGVTTPGRTNTPIISTAATTNIVASPAASTTRTVKYINISNADASVSNKVTVLHTDGTNQLQLVQAILIAGEGLRYQEGIGWTTVQI